MTLYPIPPALDPTLDPGLDLHGTPTLHLVPDAVGDLAGALADVLGPEDLDAAVDQRLVVRRRIAVTHDVVTLVLQSTVAGPLRFSPGQYLTVVVDVAGRPVERCYTISSPPTRPHLLTITVKRVPGGEVSTWLHDEIRVGEAITARGPLGTFTVTDHPASSYLLLSAGSGITPTLSTLRALADLAEPVDVVVVHSARSERDLVCRVELEALALTTEGLRLHWVREDADGRLSPELLRSWVPDVADRELLVCGPAGYMDAVRAMLPTLGVDPERHHEESFVLGTPAAPAVPAPVAAGTGEGVETSPRPGATVRLRRSGRDVVCGARETVLEAAARAGVVMPSSCQQGMCGSCKSTLLSGEVDMQHQGGIRPREVAQRQFLPCCSVPQGDIEVDA